MAIAIHTIIVRDIVGEICITLSDGEKLYDVIHPKIQQGEVVTLDFTGIHYFASPFMNAAIGQLFADIPPATVQRCLQLDRSTINKVGLTLYERMIENAIEYFTDPVMRKAIDEVLSRDITEWD